MIEPIEGDKDITLGDEQRAVDFELVKRGVEHTVREYMFDTIGHSFIQVRG